MARRARGQDIDPAQIQIVHAMQRCVRRAYLCGDDPYSGISYEHRRRWIRERLELLSSAFAIDCLTYTVLSNHLHVVLRSRPDVVRAWSDTQVVRHWLRIFPRGRNKDGSPAKPKAADIKALRQDKQLISEWRKRLSDISWWMRCLAEVIARQANAEDQCTGRFWQGRFKAQLLLDEASLLACAAYVDLNPIRAAMAESLQTSVYTGAKDRIDDLAERKSTASDLHAWERAGHRRVQSGWMSPIEIRESVDQPGPDLCTSGRRASDKGFLPISLAAYLELLDWTGRQLKQGKAGHIPADLAPILDRLGLTSESWQALVTRFGRMFKRAAGTMEHLAAEAARRDQRWMQSPGNPLKFAA